MRVIYRNKDGNLEVLEADRIRWDDTEKKLFIQSDYYDISSNDPKLAYQYENIIYAIASVGYIDLSAYQFKVDDPECKKEDE